MFIIHVSMQPSTELERISYDAHLLSKNENLVLVIEITGTGHLARDAEMQKQFVKVKRGCRPPTE